MFFVSLASAQSARVGVVMTGQTPYYAKMHQAFLGALKGRLNTGERVEILMQRPFPDPIALGNAARKVIAAEVDLIVTYGSPATLAVLDEKSSIPVVYAGVYDPESIRLVGSKVTGCGYKISLSSLLRYLKSLKPIATLSLIYNSSEEDSVRQVSELIRLTGKQNIVLNRINFSSQRDLEQLVPALLGDASFITGSAVVNELLDDVLVRLKDNRRPIACMLPDDKEVGVTISMYQNPDEQGRKTAEMVSRILLGEKPDAVEPEIFTNSELVFNMREAEKMAIRIPINVMSGATRIIK